jgi:hypothetical protein
MGKLQGFCLKVLWKWSISMYGSSVRGTLRGGPFTGDLEGYVKKGPGNRNLYP